MASPQISTANNPLTTLLETGTLLGLTERQLLERFAARGDEAAFAALVARHGSLVFAACRRALNDYRDVEDAFQAVFLVLACKADALRSQETLAPWLHGVAVRVARRARVVAARRRSREASGDVEVGVDDDPERGLERAELRGVVDEEVNRLPTRYRSLVVLCYLDGLSHAEAAERTGCPVGTVKTRLTWARERLKHRLTRRGFGPAATLESLVVAAPIPPPALIQSVGRAALHFEARGALAEGVSAASASLARRTLATMGMITMKTIALTLLTLGFTAAGAIAYQPAASPKSDRPASAGSSSPKEDKPDVPAADAAGKGGPKVADLEFSNGFGKALDLDLRRIHLSALQKLDNEFRLEMDVLIQGKVLRRFPSEIKKAPNSRGAMRGGFTREAYLIAESSEAEVDEKIESTGKRWLEVRKQIKEQEDVIARSGQPLTIEPPWPLAAPNHTSPAVTSPQNMETRLAAIERKLDRLTKALEAKAGSPGN